MDYPKHCDKRAEKFFNEAYIGTSENARKNGANEQGYCINWNSSHEDLIPTSSFRIDSDYYCVYCANKMYPIQDGLRRRGFGEYPSHQDYEVTGHACVCKHAMNEIEMNRKLNELKEQCQENCNEIMKKYNLNINKSAICKLIQSFLKDPNSYSTENLIKQIGEIDLIRKD